VKQSLLKSGDMVSGRFEIVEELGAGGMGQVYLVKDRLDPGEPRALKTVLPAYSEDPRFAERFRVEIAAALKITHPNVCRVYDLGVDSNREPALHFYTMEYLSGETLRDRLARESNISLETALVVLRGIAAGLDAAHRSGVIHRDLKPSNIILAAMRWDSPVLMDFGLAKRTDMDTPLTRTADQLGTPAFMAPEQFSGGPIGPWTDIYALGRIVSEIVKEPQSARWNKALDRALARNPQDRFASAGEMFSHLQIAVAWHKGRRRLVWIAVTVSTLSLSAAGFRYIIQNRIPAVPLVMLAPVTSALDQPNAAGAAKAFSRVLSYQIGRSERVAIVSPERMNERWKQLGGTGRPIDDSAARLIARAEGAPFVLFAQVGSMAGQAQVQLRLEAAGLVPKSKTIEFGAVDDLPAVAEETGAWIRDQLRRPGVNPRDPGMPELTTSKFAAMERYVSGDEAWKLGNPSEAIVFLEEAIQIDPRFAAAEARLGDILLSLQQSDNGYVHWARAAELARESALTTKELLRIRGQFAADTGDMAESERAFSLYIASYPDDGLGYFYKAFAVSAQGDMEQAAALCAEAAHREPRGYSFAVGWAAAQADIGDLDSAWRTLERARPVEVRDAWIDQTEAAICFARRQFDRHAQLIERIALSNVPDVRSRGYHLQAWSGAESGLYKDARAQLLEGLDFDKKHGLRRGVLVKLRLMAQLALLEGDRTTSISHCKEMLNLAAGAKDRLHAGCLLAQAGDIPGAGKCFVPGLPDWPIYRHWAGRLEGEIALANGLGQRAVALLRGLPSNGGIREWPEYLARAARAAGDGAVVDEQQANLKRFIVRYAIEPERTGIGFLSWYRSQHASV
jgi:tetratricopeptide (TPR) repeat protein